jgi:hypothetical protein
VPTACFCNPSYFCNPDFHPPKPFKNPNCCDGCYPDAKDLPIRGQKAVAELNPQLLSAAWHELEASLRKANKLYLNQADGGRAAAFHQLSAVNRFISSISDNDRLLQMPLFALNIALYYLDLGVIEPMLTPKGRSQRRGRRPEEGLLKVRSAVAMSQLFEIGYDRQTAASQIADEPATLGYQTSAGAVADWRDGFIGRSRNNANGELYRSMFATENESIGRRSNAPKVDEYARPKLARAIIEPFRKYVLLARLTTQPNLSKVLASFRRPVRLWAIPKSQHFNRNLLVRTWRRRRCRRFAKSR